MLRFLCIMLTLLCTYSCPVSVEDAWNCMTKGTGKPFLTEAEILKTYASNAGYVTKKALHYLALNCDSNSDGLITLADVKKSGCAKSCAHRMVIQKKFC